MIVRLESIWSRERKMKLKKNKIGLKKKEKNWRSVLLNQQSNLNTIIRPTKKLKKSKKQSYNPRIRIQNL